MSAAWCSGGEGNSVSVDGLASDAGSRVLLAADGAE